MSASRCAVVTSGVVTNVIVADYSTFSIPGSTLVASSTAQIGDTYAGGVFTTPSSPPSYQTTGLTFLQFIGLLTPTEQAAFINSTDTQIKLFNLMAAGAPAIDLNNPEVVTGVQYAVSIGLLTSARAATILSGAPHP